MATATKKASGKPALAKPKVTMKPKAATKPKGTLRPKVTGKSASAVKPSRLKQDVVIHTAEGERTGAQAIAPDHTPRGRAAPVGRVTPGLLATPASGRVHKLSDPAGLREQVEQFLYLQSELLDAKDWQGYIDLFADDGVYWMPVTPEQTDWQGEPSIFAEDKLLMEVRMGRVSHPTAWSQAPMWATNHVVGNIAIESADAKEVVVRSRFHMMELRRDTVRHFGGTYRHTLVRTADGLRIRMQRVDLFNGQAPFDYVLQIWV